MKDIGRRGFLSLLGGGVVGVALAEALPTWLVYEPAKLLKLGADAAGLDTLTAAILKEFERQWQGKSHVIPDVGVRMSDEMPHQFQIGIMMYPEVAVCAQERWVKPTADALVSEAQRLGLTKFGKLALPVGGAHGAIAVSERAAIRGVCQYDLDWDTHNLRFDILGCAA